MAPPSGSGRGSGAPRPGGRGGSGRSGGQGRPSHGGSGKPRTSKPGAPKTGRAGAPSGRAKPAAARRDDRQGGGAKGGARGRSDRDSRGASRSGDGDRGRRSGRPAPAPDPADRPGWGGLTRRGARRLNEDSTDGGPPERNDREEHRARPAPQRRLASDRPSAQTDASTDPDDDVWILEEVRHEATDAVGRAQIPATRRPAGKAPGRARRSAPPPVPRRAADDADERSDDLAGELAKQAGARRAGKLEDRLRSAGRAFSRERYPEARTELRKLVREVPGSASVRELLGLTYYRLGQWKEAVRELEAFRTLTGSAEQHPVLADCYRALGRHHEVEVLWEELREYSPSAELVAEGRIVAAGSLADQGRLPAAVDTLRSARWRVKHPREHHLRMAYALADLYERSGDAPMARQIFAWVAQHDRDFADVVDRQRALG